MKKIPIEKINFADHWKFNRSLNEYFVPEYRYKDLVVPKDLFRLVQGVDLQDYGKEQGHSFTKDFEGNFGIKGKEYVRIKDNRWVNEKTKTHGGTLEFINYCHNESWLETLKRFDTAGRVQKVQTVAADKTPSFKAFYAPDPFRKKKEAQKIDFEGVIFETSRILSTLSKDRKVQAFPSNKFKFVSQENPNSSLTVHRKGNSWVTRKVGGIRGTFFSRTTNSKDPLLIFEDPVAFLSSGKFVDRMLNDRKAVNVVVPMKPLDEFINENKQKFQGHSKVRIVRSKDPFLWGYEGTEKSITEDQKTEWEKALGIKYSSIEELLKELILGRTR